MTFCRTLLTALAVVTTSLLGEVQSAHAEKIYVYRESGGVIRFSNKAPRAGVRAEVFTAKGARYSVYGRSSRGIGRIFPATYHEIIVKKAALHRIEPALVKAVIHAESGFNPKAVSPKGALGLMQLMPMTARMYSVKKPFDPEENVGAGVKHLAKLIKGYDGNLKLALAAYNAGEEAVRQYRGIPPYRETQNYVQKVMSLRTRYLASASAKPLTTAAS